MGEVGEAVAWARSWELALGFFQMPGAEFDRRSHQNLDVWDDLLLQCEVWTQLAIPWFIWEKHGNKNQGTH